MARADGVVGLKSAAGDHWIVRMPDRGWIAWDEPSRTCMGRPGGCCPETRARRRPRATGSAERAQVLRPYPRPSVPRKRERQCGRRADQL